MKSLTVLAAIFLVLALLLGCAPSPTPTQTTQTPEPTPTPAEFTVSSLSVTPSEVKPGQQVRISAVVTNTGGSEGSYAVILKINDVEETRKQITIEAGKNETIDFSVVRDKEGSYKVSIDDKVGQFSVSVPTATYTPPPTPPASTGPYTGPLFDTHLHLAHLYSGQLSRLRSAEELFSYLDGGKVDWAIGFYGLPSDTSSPVVSRAEPIISGAGRRVIPLLQPSSTWRQFASGQYSEAVLRQYLQPQGLLWGVGEICLYKAELQSVTFDSPVMQNVFQVVNEMKGIVMIHPSGVSVGGRPTELAEVEPSIRKYPDAIFLFHGASDAFDLAVSLMSKYPNVYFTMDAANWMFYSKERGGMYPKDAGSANAESFLAEVNRIGFDRMVEESLKKVAPRLQQYPDRILWGTDLGHPWHFEESVTDVVIRMSRQLIGRLPADIQEKYAYQNAQRVFGRFLTPKQ